MDLEQILNYTLNIWLCRKLTVSTFLADQSVANKNLAPSTSICQGKSCSSREMCDNSTKVRSILAFWSFEDFPRSQKYSYTCLLCTCCTKYLMYLAADATTGFWVGKPVVGPWCHINTKFTSKTYYHLTHCNFFHCDSTDSERILI